MGADRSVRNPFLGKIDFPIQHPTAARSTSIRSVTGGSSLPFTGRMTRTDTLHDGINPSIQWYTGVRKTLLELFLFVCTVYVLFGGFIPYITLNRVAIR